MTNIIHFFWLPHIVAPWFPGHPHTITTIAALIMLSLVWYFNPPITPTITPRIHIRIASVIEWNGFITNKERHLSIMHFYYVLLLFDLIKKAPMHTRGKSRKQVACSSLSICCQCPNTMRSLRILSANEHDMTLPLSPLVTLGGIHCWSGTIRLWSHQISIVPLWWRVERSIDSNYRHTLQTTKLLYSSLLVAICTYVASALFIWPSLLIWPSH